MAEWTLDMINLKVWWGDFPGLANVIGGGGNGMGNTFKSMADSCQCMAKITTIL